MTSLQIAPMIKDVEMEQLRWAYVHLEHPSLAARMSAVLAVPVEEGIKLLPKKWQKQIDRTAQATICRLLRPGALPMVSGISPRTSKWTHRFLAAGTGAVGGFFGPLTLAAEMPAVTMLMLHAIADIARQEGEDLETDDARLACAQVFALGGRTKDDDAADLGYYALRIMLGLHFEQNILTAAGSQIPGSIELARAIAARFGVVISDHAAARAIPVAGAVTGAMLNLIFMNHYQDVARGHFIVRRLERDYGNDRIRELYEQIATEDLREQSYNPVVGW
ncbi:MAG: EcsC family protein [Chromatiales bacterium]|jgi:hypothetical protein